MERNIRLIPAARGTLSQIRELYTAAFPPSERKPFFLLCLQQRRGVSELLAIMDGARFLGLMVVVLYRDMAMLDYFAVLPEARGGGVGGAALAKLRARHQNRRLFLEIERVNPAAANNEQRARRKVFYLENGMRESGIKMRVFKTDMELMYADAPVGFSEYCALLRATLGPVFYRIIRPVEECASSQPT